MAPPATPTMDWMKTQVLIRVKGHIEPDEFNLFFLVDLEDASSADDQGEEQREKWS